MVSASLHKKQTAPPIARDDIIRALGGFANDYDSIYDTLNFQALPPDTSLFDAPTFSVEIVQKGIKIGTYKFNIIDDAILENHGCTIVFSPLVIQWEDGGKYKQPGMDKDIIGHCLHTIRSFIKNGACGYDVALLTTAYLTTQRAGKNFFADMGWTVIEYDKNETCDQTCPLAAPFAQLSERIEALSAPHRTSAAEVNHICFAYILI